MLYGCKFIDFIFCKFIINYFNLSIEIKNFSEDEEKLINVQHLAIQEYEKQLAIQEYERINS